MAAFNEEYRFGSARFAAHRELVRADMFGLKGPALGYVKGNLLRYDGDASLITIGGAGSGKLRDILAYNVCAVRQFSQGRRRRHWLTLRRAFINDLRGELTAISLSFLALLGIKLWVLNPYGMHGLPQHRINPWDMLILASKTLDADIKILLADLVVLSGSPNAEYFELRAREWGSALVKTLVFHRGAASMPLLYDLVNECEDKALWEHTERAMLATPYVEVHRIAREITNKRESVPKEYGAILGELYKSLSFLSDPNMYHMLSGSDVSTEILCLEDSRITNIVPAEYVDFTAPAQRAIIGSVMLYKQRHPDAQRVYVVADEASVLRRFESLLRGYTYGRGMGITMWTIWQDLGQIKRNYGPEAVSSFLGSSAVRQFFGVRDLETAKIVSEMLGNQTLTYDDALEQAAARRNKIHLLRVLLRGGNPLSIAANYRYEAQAAAHRSKQQRPLMTPDEVMNMAEDEQILFVAGKDLHPILANKYPYYTRPELVPSYRPNPYHPPADRVLIATSAGPRWARVATERVPREFACFPQFPDGRWTIIEGYRPF